MKILILQDDFPPMHFGGAGAVADNLAGEFKKRGHDVRVVTTVRTNEEAGEIEYNGLTIHRIATSYDLRLRAYIGLWNPRVVREVTAVIRSFKPDVVHAHNVHNYLSY